MLKKTSIVVMGFMLLFAFAFAAPVFAHGQAETTHSATKVVHLQVWSPYASPYTRPYFDEIVKEFDSNHPGIQVTHVPISANMGAKFRTAVLADDAPAVVAAGWDQLYSPGGKSRAQIEKQSPFVYLDKVIPASTLNKIIGEDYQDGWLSDQAYYGGPIGLPFEMSARVLFYNRTLFKEAGLNPNDPPKTIQEFDRDAKAISNYGKTSGSGAWGYLYDAKNPSEIAFRPLNIAAPLNGSLVPYGYKNKQGKYVFTLAQEKNVQALDAFYKNLEVTGMAGPMLGYGYMTGRGAFGEGKVGMYIIGTYMMVVYNKEYPNLKYGMANLPTMSPNGEYVDGGTDTWLWITKKSLGGNPSAAGKFVEFMAQKGPQAIMMQKAGKLVPNRNSYTLPGLPSYLLQAEKVLQTRLAEQHAYVEREITEYPDMQSAKKGTLLVASDHLPQAIGGGQVVQDAGQLFQKYLLGQMTAKQYLITLEKDWASVMSQNGIPYVKSSVGWKESK